MEGLISLIVLVLLATGGIALVVLSVYTNSLKQTNDNYSSMIHICKKVYDNLTTEHSIKNDEIVFKDENGRLCVLKLGHRIFEPLLELIILKKDVQVPEKGIDDVNSRLWHKRYTVEDMFGEGIVGPNKHALKIGMPNIKDILDEARTLCIVQFQRDNGVIESELSDPEVTEGKVLEDLLIVSKLIVSAPGKEKRI